MNLAPKYRPYYTYEDYCEWEGNWELIDGLPYAMSPSPVPIHQRISILLGMVLENALKKSCKKCKVFSPIDWKIDEHTVVQPDLLIVCKKIEKKYLDFSPILVVEILSPSTASKDRNEKKELYQSQKVKYYLIIDSQFFKIEIYELINHQYQPVALNPSNHLFTFEDECKADVDFTEIWD